MEYTVNAGKNWHTVVTVSVPADQIQPRLDAKYQDYQSRVKLQGFRKGKVPPQLVKKMFGKKIEAEIFQPFFSEAVKKVFDENQFDMLNTPEITDVKYDPQDGLSFALTFDVRPHFEVTGFRGMEVEKQVFTITEQDVADTLEDLRQQNAMIYTVEGEAQKGHLLVADMQELDRAGLPLVGKKFDSQLLQLGDENDHMTRQLLGIKPGEERRIHLLVQQEGSEIVNTLGGELAQEQFFAVKVKEIKERRVPELDDEFAKDVGDFETLQALKEDLEQKLKRQAESDSSLLFQQALADEIIKRTDLELPPSMIERYLQALVEDLKSKSKEKIDEAAVREHYKSYAIREIKWHLVREQLIKQEGITVTDEEVEAGINALENAGKTGASRAKSIREDEKEREAFKNKLVEDKVYDLLARQAEIKEIKRPWRKQREEN